MTTTTSPEQTTLKKGDRVTLTCEFHHVSAGVFSYHSIDGTVLSITQSGYIKVQFDSEAQDREMKNYAGRTMNHPLEVWNAGGSRLAVEEVGR